MELFKFNLWANLRLLEACADLEIVELNAALPGTFGSIGETLVHLVAAEERYLTLRRG
ncbi:MAG TPA: DinB family protein [Ktedonobacterales bacterium]|nr:DinB family protein [Ktedonobacterales bacterium]